MPDRVRREEVVSFDEASRRELVEFAECVSTGRSPRTPGADGLADLRLCQAIARAHQAQRPQPFAATVGVGGSA